MQDAYFKTAGNLAGECFAPSQAVLKPLEQPELQVLADIHAWGEALSCGGPVLEKRGSNRMWGVKAFDSIFRRLFGHGSQNGSDSH